MRYSLESMNRGHDMDIPKDLEGVSKSEDEPKTFEEHMREMGDPRGMQELKDLINALPAEDNQTTSSNNEAHRQDIDIARNAVLDAFNKDGADKDERITNCKNRVFRSEFGPRYDGDPNVFRTSNKSIYRITGMNQLADIVNCGYVRPKEGKLKGGHTNEVFWTEGGDRLNFIDKRPILEVSASTMKDGQIGALGIDQLAAVWVFNEGSGKRENKLDNLKFARSTLRKNEQVDAESLAKKIGKEIDLLDIADSF